MGPLDDVDDPFRDVDQFNVLVHIIEGDEELASACLTAGSLVWSL